MLESWTLTLPVQAQALVRGGYLAVQTFFLLSGFVLARSYARAGWTPKDLLNYGVARLARIYPVYLLSLLIVTPFIRETMLKPYVTPGHKAALLAEYVFVLQGWTGGLGVGWNTPAWSLSCEFFFYLLFPLVFPALRHAGRIAVGATLALCLVAPVLMARAGVPWEWKPLHHFFDFLAGIAAARLYEFLSVRMRGRGAWFYFAALIFGAVLIVYPQLMEGTYGDLNTGLRPLNVLALVGLALGGGWPARALSTSLADYLGRISYSTYILHVPVLWWYGRWALHASLFGRLHISRPLAAVLYLVLVVGISALSFRWVEVPANRWIRARIAARSPQASEVTVSEVPLPAVSRRA